MDVFLLWHVRHAPFLDGQEMWLALRVGHGMVDRIDALTRRNRSKGTGTAFITHSARHISSSTRKKVRVGPGPGR